MPNRRRLEPVVVPGGRRVQTLTLKQVADAIQVDVRTVRKLMKFQREEDTAASGEGRTPRQVGLRGIYISRRVTRVSEQALGDYLRSSGDNR
jgi:hypothetical protein